MKPRKATYYIPAENGGHEEVHFTTTASQVIEEKNKKFVEADEKEFLEQKENILLKKDVSHNPEETSTKKIASARSVSMVKEQLGDVYIQVGGNKPSPDSSKIILWIEVE